MDAKSYILSDLPTEKDGLDFAPYVNTLVEVITSPNTSTPLTLGIFGTWGSGKTSLMRMIEKGLPKSFRTTWFNAWMYDKEDTLWRVLLLHVLTALKEAIPENKPNDIERLNDLEAALYKPVGQYSPRGDSPYGCADMSGNIWEWCADWFNETEYENRIGMVVCDPHGPEEGEYRVLRGGSFILGQNEARCASRFRLKPFYWFDFGFRVAMSMPTSETD